MFCSSRIVIFLLCFFSSFTPLSYSYSTIDVSQLKNNEIAILQYDSRDLSPDIKNGQYGSSNAKDSYWNTAAKWNQNYCNNHGHVFLYYTITKVNKKFTKRNLVSSSSGKKRSKGKRKTSKFSDDGQCYYDRIHDGNKSIELLATPWCKVKAMINANDDYPDIKFFIYMDSDAVIDRKFADIPLNKLMKRMQDNLEWDPIQKPIIFNQDGPCWWCTLIQNVGYNMCLNAGTVVWYRHRISEMVLNRWWDASMDPELEGNPIRRRFRLKWPWEQDRQMSVYNSSSQYIQVASQPDRIHMKSHVPWCLSHLPSSGCFISHYCEGTYSKLIMREKYSVNNHDFHKKDNEEEEINYNNIKIKINYLTFEKPFII